MIFKLKLVPIFEVVKDRDWEVSKVRAGRKEKLCSTCGTKIPIGEGSINFVKRTTTSTGKTMYDTKYACKENCAITLAVKLGIPKILNIKC